MGVCNGMGLSVFCMNRVGQSEGLNNVTGNRGRHESTRSITKQAQGSFDVIVGFQANVSVAQSLEKSSQI